MEGFGVETRLISRFTAWPTPVSIITVNESNGSRTVVNRRAPDAGRGDLSFATVESGTAPRLLLFDGHELAASIAAMERWPDALTMLDAGSLREGTRVLAERVGCLAASERFVSQLLGLDNLRDRRAWPRAIATLHEINGNPGVITLGENGLIAGTADSWFHLPAFETSPIDTTGAGDIFHGALAYSVLREMDQQEGLRLASAAAALSVRHRGSSASIPTLEEVHRYLAGVPRLAANWATDIISE
jgi:sugar/nucleoside kinase (ribokinase family)